MYIMYIKVSASHNILPDICVLPPFASQLYSLEIRNYQMNHFLIEKVMEEATLLFAKVPK